jgi:hypothetical protein
MDLEEKLIEFHRNLMPMIPRTIPPDSRFSVIVDSLDEIISDVGGVKFKTCPFCHSMLYEGDGTKKTWTCNSIGNHGGQRLVFLEGSKNCEYTSKDGPYCTWHGFCLCQVHGPLGHPVRCKVGRIDDQSPK